MSMTSFTVWCIGQLNTLYTDITIYGYTFIDLYYVKLSCKYAKKYVLQFTMFRNKLQFIYIISQQTSSFTGHRIFMTSQF